MNKIIFVSILLFLLSLTQPAVKFEKVCKDFETRELNIAGLSNVPVGEIETLDELKLLLAGFLGVLFVQFGAWGWLANAMFIVTLVLSRDVKSINNTVLLSVSASLLASTSLFLTNWFPLPADEGVVCYYSAISAERGYWLWLGSILLITIGVWKLAYKPIKRG